MDTYLIINAAIIVIPLLLLFERKVKYYKKLPYVLGSIIPVGIPYILWDIAATRRGDWAFNTDYVTGTSAFGLPIEEILFFITVPFSCIFIYESLSVYLENRIFKLPRTLFIILGLIFVTAGFFFGNQSYTSIVSLFTGAFLIISSVFGFGILRSSRYWIYVAITFIPFFIVNYLLTSLPVVTYNPAAISGIRITTIPAEDFLYSFSLLSFYIMIYLSLGNIWSAGRK
jgi:lycopene cyclase domain-containing protein